MENTSELMPAVTASDKEVMDESGYKCAGVCVSVYVCSCGRECAYQPVVCRL